jgi:hypothetical protein
MLVITVTAAVDIAIHVVIAFTWLTLTRRNGSMCASWSWSLTGRIVAPSAMSTRLAQIVATTASGREDDDLVSGAALADRRWIYPDRLLDRPGGCGW